MRLVPSNCAREGCYLAKTIYDSKGRVLLSKDVLLTQKIIKKIELNGIVSVYINDEFSDNEIEDIIKPELRQKAISIVKESYRNLASIEEKKIKNNINRIIKIKKSYINNIYTVVEQIIDEIFLKRDMIINLVDIKSMDNYTYEHCVNVTVLALIIGLELNYTKKELFDLAVGAMLHDIGKVFIPKEILLKKDKLTDSEYSIVKQHPEKGYEYLKSDVQISALSSIIILQHHEKVDGTGYPSGLLGNKIHTNSKITSIADVYDALTSDRPYRQGLTPNEALEYIMGSADRSFDYDLVNAFLKRIVPYPVGTIVNLSNGDLAVIEEANMKFPLRPKIKIIKDINGKKEYIKVDLTNSNDLVIKGVQYALK